MKAEHLETSLAETARIYAGSGDAVQDLICEALRGVRARASRYEANDPDPNGEEMIRAIVREEVERMFSPISGE